MSSALNFWEVSMGRKDMEASTVLQVYPCDCDDCDEIKFHVQEGMR